jgi:hypothetical protein
MQARIIVGIVLIVLGAAGLVVQGISCTTRKNLVDVGGLKLSTETRKTIPVPLVAGGLALAAGIAVVLVASRKP